MFLVKGRLRGTVARGKSHWFAEYFSQTTVTYVETLSLFLLLTKRQ